MSDESGHKRPEIMLDTGLAFFGAVVASVSHEMNNVVSIVDQTAGLLDDLIAGEKHGVPLSIERLEEAVKSVQRQTGRGLALVKRLNRFAHSADENLIEFDINEALENLTALTERLANLKRAALTFTPAPEELLLRGNPFFLQQTVFTAVKIALTDIDREQTVAVSCRRDGDAVAVELVSPHPLDPADSRFEGLRTIVAHMDADLQLEPAGGPATIRLTLRNATPAP